MEKKKLSKIFNRIIIIMFLIMIYENQSFGKILSLQLYIQYKNIHNTLTIITGILQLVIIIGFIIWAIIYNKKSKKDKLTKTRVTALILTIIVITSIFVEIFYKRALDVMKNLIHGQATSFNPIIILNIKK